VRLAAAFNEVKPYSELKPIVFVPCAATLETDDPPDRLVDYYVTALRKRGWSISQHHRSDWQAGDIIGLRDDLVYRVSWQHQGRSGSSPTIATVVITETNIQP
jgi:hypothetical protein